MYIINLFAFVFFFWLALCSCDTDDAEAPTPLDDQADSVVNGADSVYNFDFINIKYSSDQYIDQRYAILSDTNGYVLDYKVLPTTNDGEIFLQSSAPTNKLNVTIVSINETYSPKRDLITYSEIKPNSTLDITRRDYENFLGSNSPEVYFKIDIPFDLASKIILSHNRNNWGVWEYNARTDDQNPPFIFSLKLFDDQSKNGKAYVMLQDIENPVYAEVDNLIEGDTILLSYPIDFNKNFDHFLSFDDPNQSLDQLKIEGINEILDNGYPIWGHGLYWGFGLPHINNNLYVAIGQDISAPYKLGLLDYNYYLVHQPNLLVNSGLSIYKYLLLDSPPTSEDFNAIDPNFNMSITNQSLANFSYSFTSEEADIIKRTYCLDETETFYSWGVYEPFNSKTKNQYLLEAPSEIGINYLLSKRATLSLCNSPGQVINIKNLDYYSYLINPSESGYPNNINIDLYDLYYFFE